MAKVKVNNLKQKASAVPRPKTCCVNGRKKICKRIGKCDTFHVPLFIAIFRARWNADVLQIVWFIIKPTLAEVWKQNPLFRQLVFKVWNSYFYFCILSTLMTYLYITLCYNDLSGCQKSLEFWNSSPSFYVSLLHLGDLENIFRLAEKFKDQNGLKPRRKIDIVT
jgi:hypothetical protein